MELSFADIRALGRCVLAAGNACVVKPAEDACLSLLRVAELAAGAGFPDGALNIVTGLGDEVGAALVGHAGVAHVSFTGSPATGAAVASAAAKRHCPVLAATSFDDEEHAVRLANATDYGLVTGVRTRDDCRQLRMARALRSGQVFINNYRAGGGVELPFGGVRHYGHGRKKGFEALYGFTTLKTVVLRHG